MESEEKSPWRKPRLGTTILVMFGALLPRKPCQEKWKKEEATDPGRKKPRERKDGG